MSYNWKIWHIVALWFQSFQEHNLVKWPVDVSTPLMSYWRRLCGQPFDEWTIKIPYTRGALTHRLYGRSRPAKSSSYSSTCGGVTWPVKRNLIGWKLKETETCRVFRPVNTYFDGSGSFLLHYLREQIIKLFFISNFPQSLFFFPHTECLMM